MIVPQLKVRMQTFDRAIITRNWKRINAEPLKLAGLKVMLNARESIRYRPKKTARGKASKPSGPGRPPRSRIEGKTAPFKMIFSVPMRAGTSAIVGMVGFGGGGELQPPELHEHGGQVVRLVRKEGGFKHKHSRKTHGKYAKKNSAGVWKTVGGKPKFIPLKERRSVVYPARPFMQPALEKAHDKFPHLWRGALKRAR